MKMSYLQAYVRSTTPTTPATRSCGCYRVFWWNTAIDSNPAQRRVEEALNQQRQEVLVGGSTYSTLEYSINSLSENEPLPYHTCLIERV